MLTHQSTTGACRVGRLPTVTAERLTGYLKWFNSNAYGVVWWVENPPYNKALRLCGGQECPTLSAFLLFFRLPEKVIKQIQLFVISI
ncbi:MAG: hypothetical protein IKZ88_05230 [Neisseriaceae bacterium]|nr:hypothetical protein [Neisseriaceae bacterium]